MSQPNTGSQISDPAILTAAEIQELIAPMLLHPLPDRASEQLAKYVQLLYRWNARMNLTAVCDPRLLAKLHLAECLRCAQIIPAEFSSILDFGSGAGMPGIPIRIARPELAVTLAEAQTKKASFLREVVRELELSHTHVHAGRVEELPNATCFDAVTLRAVDKMPQAIQTAKCKVASGGICMVLTSENEAENVRVQLPDLRWKKESIPGTAQRVLLIGSKTI